ncbi:MAG: family 2 glycosyl transferase [Oscillatoria sp. PMC 1068.18]|nr:family 2 glycosyl transferase [Oscillatoria sp. PMC 1076.18]MEC4991642.1 family 2 glycosyl transferase [Oscillatoria sp. PMC 1068.18]
MLWEVRIKYANGSQQVLRTCKNQETALRCVDAIYARGYPLHLAYFACPAPA